MRDWKPWLAIFINHARRSLSLSKCHSCHRSWHTTGPTIPDRLFAQLSTRSELSDFRMKGGPVTWTENFVRRQSTIKTESTCCALAQSTRSTASSFQHFSHCACCTYLDFLLQGLRLGVVGRTSWIWPRAVQRKFRHSELCQTGPPKQTVEIKGNAPHQGVPINAQN